MSLSTPQEQAILNWQNNIGTPAAVPQATQLQMCTAAPEDGSTGLSTATAIAIGTFQIEGAEVATRTRCSNVGTRVFTNDSGASIDVTHIAKITAGGVVTEYMALPASVTVPNGATLTFQAAELRFDLG